MGKQTIEKMKKVGMITIYRKNYGAFLQTYALQQTLIKLGYTPEVIRYDYYKDHTLFTLSMATHPSFAKLLKAAIVELVRYVPHKKREQVFNQSIKKHINESAEYYKEYSELEQNPPCYDIYITGSDQVFNPKLSLQAMPARQLRFVKNGIKASYAASSGADDIDEIYINALRTFNAISVREEGLATCLQKTHGLKAIAHIDPVFLLDKKDWENFAEPIEDLGGNYIFYYRVLPQKEIIEKAKEISTKLHLPIFVADGHDKFENQIKRKGILSPEQWVYALNHATYIVTNSFHGTAFAINMQKSADIIIPPKGENRIKNLMTNCSQLNLFNSSMNINFTDSRIFEEFSCYINEERKKSIDYLSSLSLF